MKKIAIALLLAACKTSSASSSTSAVAVTRDGKDTETATVTQRVETGPETITTTVEEWVPGPSSPDGSDPRAGAQSTNSAVSIGGRVPAAPPRGYGSNPTLPAHPVLVKRTTIVDQRGPASTDTHVEAAGASETHAEVKGEAKSESKHTFAPAGLFALLGALWPWLLLAGAVAALGYWRKGLVGAVVGWVRKLLP